jgi:hypothetical protein
LEIATAKTEIAYPTKNRTDAIDADPATSFSDAIEVFDSVDETKDINTSTVCVISQR